jgi:hypothetical protein
MYPIEMDNQSVFKIACRYKNFAGYVAAALTIIAA